MLDIKKLFNGIAVVIDDDIDNKDASINFILKQLEKNNIPYVKYNKLPEDSIIDNLQTVSFILLDWKLNNALSIEEINLGVKIPEGVEKENDELNISFLKKLQEKCFCPIFIFTAEEPGFIKEKLKQASLYKEGKCSNILIRAKEDFKNEGSLFKEIEKWLIDTAPIYLLKEWDYAYQIAKSKLFIDFQQRSADWVRILWRTYKGDNVNPSIELEEFITRSIQTQMLPLSLDSNYFTPPDINGQNNELISCLERQCFIQEPFLDKNFPATGDIFEIDNKYYINIRPICDLIPHDGKPVDEIELYCLKIERIKKQKTIVNLFNGIYGKFEDNDTYYLVYPACNGFLLKIIFKNIVLKKWKEVKAKRGGRLLPPFLTKLQMKYASYLQRQGFPKMPNDLFDLSLKDSEKNLKEREQLIDERERQIKERENELNNMSIFKIIWLQLKKKLNKKSEV